MSSSAPADLAQESKKERDKAAEDREFSELKPLLLSGDIEENQITGNRIRGLEAKLYADIDGKRFHWFDNEEYFSEAIRIIIKWRAFDTLDNLLRNYLNGEGKSKNLIKMLEKQKDEYFEKCGTYLLAIAAKCQDFDLLRFLLSKNIKLDHDSLRLGHANAVIGYLLGNYKPKTYVVQYKFESLISEYKIRTIPFLGQSPNANTILTFSQELSQALMQVSSDAQGIIQREKEFIEILRLFLDKYYKESIYTDIDVYAKTCSEEVQGAVLAVLKEYQTKYSGKKEPKSLEERVRLAVEQGLLPLNIKTGPTSADKASEPAARTLINSQPGGSVASLGGDSRIHPSFPHSPHSKGDRKGS